jgi:nucleotide-binding universal stress UspA family protein
MRTNRILVPLDGSDLAEAALTAAFDLAAGQGIVLLVRAAEAHVLPGRDPIPAQIDAVAEAESYVAGLKAKLERRGVRNVETHVWYGSPAASIIDAAKAHKADLIVMSTHGRSGLGRLVSCMPPISRPPRRGPSGARWRWRRATGPSCFWSTPVAPLMFADGYVSPKVYVQMEAAARTEAQKRLRRLMEQAKRVGVPTKTLLLDGLAHERIVQAARGRKADLVVIGTHGRTGLARFFLGSVASRVLALSPCPVLTVRGR